MFCAIDLFTFVLYESTESSLESDGMSYMSRGKKKVDIVQVNAKR